MTKKKTPTRHDRLMDAWLDAPNDYAREQALIALGHHARILTPGHAAHVAIKRLQKRKTAR